MSKQQLSEALTILEQAPDTDTVLKWRHIIEDLLIRHYEIDDSVSKKIMEEVIGLIEG